MSSLKLDSYSANSEDLQSLRELSDRLTTARGERVSKAELLREATKDLLAKYSSLPKSVEETQPTTPTNSENAAD